MKRRCTKPDLFTQHNLPFPGEYCQGRTPRRGRRLLLIAGLVFLLAVISVLLLKYKPVAETGIGPSAFTASGEMDIWFFDVGQGDSILIRSPGGKYMLVDSGPAENGNGLINMLDLIGPDVIDFFVCTHSHSDHTGNAERILKRYDVRTVCLPYHADLSEYGTLQRAIEQEGCKVLYLMGSMSPEIDLDPDLEILTLSPLDAVYPDENERSIMLHIKYGNTAVLLAGDAGELAERLVVKAYPNRLLKANILKVGHHGSNSGSCEKFLRAISPSLAVVSCGEKNEYGHPSASVLERMAELSIPVVTTAENGTIHIRLDGNSIQVVE